MFSSWDIPVQRIPILYNAGQYIIFDYRLRHRGLGNKSAEARPLLYITYAKKNFADEWNFSKKRYKNLPTIAKAMTRDERVAKRKQQEASRAANPTPSKKKTKKG